MGHCWLQYHLKLSGSLPSGHSQRWEARWYYWLVHYYCRTKKYHETTKWCSAAKQCRDHQVDTGSWRIGSSWGCSFLLDSRWLRMWIFHPPSSNPQPPTATIHKSPQPIAGDRDPALGIAPALPPSPALGPPANSLQSWPSTRHSSKEILPSPRRFSQSNWCIMVHSVLGWSKFIMNRIVMNCYLFVCSSAEGQGIGSSMAAKVTTSAHRMIRSYSWLRIHFPGRRWLI